MLLCLQSGIFTISLFALISEKTSALKLPSLPLGRHSRVPPFPELPDKSSIMVTGLEIVFSSLQPSQLFFFFFLQLVRWWRCSSRDLSKLLPPRGETLVECVNLMCFG